MTMEINVDGERDNSTKFFLFLCSCRNKKNAGKQKKNGRGRRREGGKVL